MDVGLTVLSGDVEYIARTSGGKDSTKMLDVIVSRGLPLDRITKTDIWATDTIRGEHPKMVEFEARWDEYVWKKYHIEVEHLCAMKNGKKLTYEKMFYHSPVNFHPDGHTVHDFDRRFELEDMGLIPKDRRFKWEMIYEMGLLMGPEWKGATI